MKKVSKSTMINAKVEEVFNYVTNSKNEPEWMPGMLENSGQIGNGVGDTYQWKYRMAGITFEGESSIAEYEPNKRYRTISKVGINSDFLFIFEPKDGRTLLELNIEYEIPVPVLGKLAENVIHKRNERETEMSLQSIKEMVEN